MEDREFFDHLYQMWVKTTGAADMYWMPERHESKPKGGPSAVFYIQAVNEQDEKKRIASYVSEDDSDWITAVHGCFGDLVRRLHAALDEADTADFERDSRECRIAELELENQKLIQIIQGLSNDPPWHQRSG